MSVLNYTTKVPAAKTMTEMQTMLAKAGASRIAVDFDDARPAGFSFALPTAHGNRIFTLPVDVAAMQRLLAKENAAGRLSGRSKASRESLEQAERVAWRVVKDWLAAQLTLARTEMATIDQVMLPYLNVDHSGHTLYEAYREREDVLQLEGSR